MPEPHKITYYMRIIDMRYLEKDFPIERLNEIAKKEVIIYISARNDMQEIKINLENNPSYINKNYQRNKLSEMPYRKKGGIKWHL